MEVIKLTYIRPAVFSYRKMELMFAEMMVFLENEEKRWWTHLLSGSDPWIVPKMDNFHCFMFLVWKKYLYSHRRSLNVWVWVVNENERPNVGIGIEFGVHHHYYWVCVCERDREKEKPWIKSSAIERKKKGEKKHISSLLLGNLRT